MTRISITTDDGATVYNGDRVYNYYDMRPGVIASEPKTEGGSAGWFDFKADNGDTTILNGQRICSMAFAQARGFKNADPKPELLWILTISDRWEDSVYHRIPGDHDELLALGARAEENGFVTTLTRASTIADADRFLDEMQT